MSAQDPDELFDLCDESGAPLGRVKARRLVHRDGDWHRSLHVWVVLTGGATPAVLFQKRSRDKDTWPGAFDVAVTGHYRAGEGLAEALREAEEEIGLALRPEDVERLGTRHRAASPAPGIHDHEIQDILLARTPKAADELRAAPAEVDALVAIPVDDAIRLFAGAPVAAELWVTGGGRMPAVLSREDFVDAADGYYERALASIAQILGAEARSQHDDAHDRMT